MHGELVVMGKAFVKRYNEMVDERHKRPALFIPLCFVHVEARLTREESECRCGMLKPTDKEKCPSCLGG